VHPQGQLVAHTSPADGLVWLWTTDTAEPKLILIEAADGCTLEGVAFLPDGDRVVVGGIDYLSTGERDGAVCVWDLATQKKLVTFDYGVYAVAVDPSGRYVAGAGITDHVYLWDLSRSTDEEDPCLVFELEGHTDKVHTVAFSPDGSYLLSASDDLTLRIWDVLSGRMIREHATESAVQSLSFSPDGRHLFTGNANTTCSQIEFSKLLED
jgi:WD40 repeat protein